MINEKKLIKASNGCIRCLARIEDNLYAKDYEAVTDIVKRFRYSRFALGLDKVMSEPSNYFVHRDRYWLFNQFEIVNRLIALKTMDSEAKKYISMIKEAIRPTMKCDFCDNYTKFTLNCCEDCFGKMTDRHHKETLKFRKSFGEDEA